MKEYDVAIIGSGVTGSGLVYVLSTFSNVKKIALIEKYGEIASVQSSKNNNSQTLHFGDIETHYTPEKAKTVKEAADMVRIYVEKHGKHLYNKFHKMALAVGKGEVATLRKRQSAFGKIFPKLHLIGREELEKVEPKVVEGRDNDVDLLAAFTEEGYAINYGALAQSFVAEAKKSRKVDVFMNTLVKKITKNGQRYHVQSREKTFLAKSVVVAASANSLTFAHKMGYGKDFILLPVAGDFFCAENLLHGKVYMMQNPKLPFAAIHGDPDVANPKETRFGPIAKVLPILEKRKYSSFFDFLKLFRFKWAAVASIIKILSDPIYYRYVFWNVLYGLPYFGKYFFVREVKKIVPSITAKQLHYGKHIGGIRPQVVDIKKRGVALGEAKIVGENIIFNITPSPGASVCLKNAEIDAQHVCKFLGVGFDQKKFDKEFK